MKSILQVLIIVGLLAYFAIPDMNSNTTSKSIPYTPQTEKTIKPTKVLKARPKGYEYTNEKDALSSKTIKNAIVQSDNYINLNFPYSGAQKATIQVRKHPRFGNDVLIFVQKGQITPDYNNKRIGVRFDNGKVINYRVAESADHSSHIIFIKNYKHFTQRAAKAKKITIELPFYQNGNKVVTFTTSDGFHSSFK